jgi:hypothetical protein
MAEFDAIAEGLKSALEYAQCDHMWGEWRMTPARDTSPGLLAHYPAMPKTMPPYWSATCKLCKCRETRWTTPASE